MSQALTHIRIRRAVLPRDLDTLVEQRRRMWREISNSFTPNELRSADRAYRKWVVEMTRGKRFIAFLAQTKEGRIIAGGCVWVKTEGHPSPLSPRPRTPDLMSMYTDPSFRGMGLASKITKEAIKWCRAKGFSSLNLHASPMGIGIYEKLGFQWTFEMRLMLKGNVSSKNPAHLL